MSERDEAEIGELETLLKRTADAFPYPPTPAISQAVASRLQESAGPRGSILERLFEMGRTWRVGPRLRFAAAIMTGVLLSTGVLLAVPQSRTALAEIFGLEHVRVSEEPGPAGSLTPNVPRVESFAVQTTLANARGLVDFTLRFPTYPGEIGGPDAVYSQRFEDDVIIIATYEEARFDLYQSRLQGSFFKTAASVIRVTIGGGAGLWVPEGGHEASYLDVDEEEIAQSKRTVTRGTLLWEHDGVTYRLETELPRDVAIQVAESLR